MTLTVRLDDTLDSALASHCAAHGVTKSRVVQESLAAYLRASRSQSTKAADVHSSLGEQVSDNYCAFEKTGLIGCVSIGLKRGADKAGLRARIAESFAQRKARQGSR